MKVRGIWLKKSVKEGRSGVMAFSPEGGLPQGLGKMREEARGVDLQAKKPRKGARGELWPTRPRAAQWIRGGGRGSQAIGLHNH